MKRNLLFICACLLTLITSNLQAQNYSTDSKKIPQVTGMMDAKIVATDTGWAFKITKGTVYLFTTDKKHQLQNMLRAGAREIQPDKLVQLSLKTTNPIPDEFYAVPYAKLTAVRLYHCGYSEINNRVFCRNVPLPARPTIPITTTGVTRITY